MCCDSRSWDNNVYYYGKSLSDSKLSYAFVRTTDLPRDTSLYYQEDFISNIESYFSKGVNFNRYEEFTLESDNFIIYKTRYKVSKEVYLYYCHKEYTNRMKSLSAITYGDKSFSKSYNCISDVKQ